MVSTLILAVFMFIEDLLMFGAGRLGVPTAVIIIGIILIIIFHQKIFNLLNLIFKRIGG